MPKRIVLIMTVLVACVGCDQSTKAAAKAYLPETQTLSFLGGSVRLQLAKNHGAFLGLGASMPQSWRTTFLSGGVAVVLVALFAYALASTAANPVLVPAVGMVVGGGVSNLADRLLYGGYVVDFLNVGLGPVRTGIFNLADVFILTGVLLVVFGDWLTKKLLSIGGEERAKTGAPG